MHAGTLPVFLDFGSLPFGGHATAFGAFGWFRRPPGPWTMPPIPKAFGESFPREAAVLPLRPLVVGIDDHDGGELFE